MMFLVILTVVAWMYALGIRVLVPWRNLGCLGIAVDSIGFYADVYLNPNFGAFVNTGFNKYTVNRYGIRKWR